MCLFFKVAVTIWYGGKDSVLDYEFECGIFDFVDFCLHMFASYPVVEIKAETDEYTFIFDERLQVLEFADTWFKALYSK